MPPSIPQQFGNMLSSRWSLPAEKDALPSSKQKAIHEMARYPRITKVTPENNSCLNPSMSYEHVLACGHIIATAKSDQPCAPNCHHITNERSPRKRDALKKSNVLEFYCDACVETENEALISDDVSSKAAEHMRLEMRYAEAKLRGKQIKYRKCYIGLKVTSVPCHSDGRVRGRYTPREKHHAFDTAIPQVGDNFFEDMLVNPVEEPKSVSDDRPSASESTDGTDINSSPANLGEGGANYLRYTQSVAHKNARAAPQKQSDIPSCATHDSATTTTPVMHNFNTTPLLASTRQSRKRPVIMDEDDEDVKALQEEAQGSKKPAKRHMKPTISASTVLNAIMRTNTKKNKNKTESAKRKRS